MSPDGAGSDRNGSDHPAELPWYVAGTLEPEKIRLVELHLNHCPACREEARALASMQATLRTDVGQDHVTGAELVAQAVACLEYRRIQLDVLVNRQGAVAAVARTDEAQRIAFLVLREELLLVAGLETVFFGQDPDRSGC